MSLRATLSGFAAVALVALAVVSQPVQPAFANDDAVVAKVNGDNIYKKDVLAAVQQLKVPAADVDKAFPMVLDQVINEKLIDESAAGMNIEQTEDYKTRLEALKAQLQKQMYFEKILKGKVTDATVKAEYNKFKEANKGKIEVHARHILVPTKEEADKVIKDLDGGAKFEDLARERSSGPAAQKGGDLGGFMVKEEFIDPAMGEAVIKLKPGTYSKTPVKSQFGWHVFKVDEKRERKVPELTGDVDMAIRNKQSQEALQEVVKGLRAKAKIEMMDSNGKAAPKTGDAAKELEEKEAAKKDDKSDDKADDGKKE